MIGDIIVTIIILALVIMAVFIIWKSKKKGSECAGCSMCGSGSCSMCDKKSRSKSKS